MKLRDEDSAEAPYVKMTARLVEVFPKYGGNLPIEPDASSGSYFWAAGWLVSISYWLSALRKQGLRGPAPVEQPASSPATGARDLAAFHSAIFHQTGADDYLRFGLEVRHWPKSGWQIDAEFPQFIPLPATISREGQLGDSIMIAIVLAADFEGALGRVYPVDNLQLKDLASWTRNPITRHLRFTDLGRLRRQECERVVALRTELTRCGARVTEKEDTLTVWPAPLHGAEIETYNDHRMAMSFATLGLKVPGIKIKNPACVKKTFPNFFQKLAAPPPQGLGAIIRDAHTGRNLGLEELFPA